MKNIYKVHWSDNSLEELGKTFDYLEKNFSIHETNNLAEEIEKVSKLIAINPNLFPIINAEFQIRKAIVLKFNNLYYTINGEIVDVVSFFSNRQNVKKF